MVFSGNTDCYQPLEATYELTRACLAVCAEFRNPVTVITKAALIQRDLDLLQTLHERAWIRVYFSVPFADNAVARKVEPQTPSITKRLEAMAALSSAGIPTAVMIGPVIPGLNEQDIPQILHLARQAGATRAAYMLLRLNDNVQPVFLERMAAAFPDRIRKNHQSPERDQGRRAGRKAVLRAPPGTRLDVAHHRTTIRFGFSQRRLSSIRTRRRRSRNLHQTTNGSTQAVFVNPHSCKAPLQLPQNLTGHNNKGGERRSGNDRKGGLLFLSFLRKQESSVFILADGGERKNPWILD